MTDQWAVIELMGHRTLIGLVSEAELSGVGFFKIDAAKREGGFEPACYYGAASVYCLSPVSEESARERAGWNRPRGPDLFTDPFDETEEDEASEPDDGIDL